MPLLVASGMVKFLLYLARWQASSVVLAPVLALMTNTPVYDGKVILATIISNFIGGCVFFWIDRWIFKEKRQND